MAVAQDATGNLLLRSMAPLDFAMLQPHFIRLPLPRNLALHKAGARIDRVYFPEDGVVSVVAIALDGKSCEVGVFGREGMSETATVLGTDFAPFEAYVQVPGRSALQLTVATLNEGFERSPTLRQHLLRYVQAMMVQASSSIAAAAQTIEPRLARWLLMCHDRIDDNDVRLTHEFLAMMLNVRRAGVSEALESLRERGLLTLRRSEIKIDDRAGLERLAAGSYGLAEAEYERLIEQPLRKRLSTIV